MNDPAARRRITWLIVIGGCLLLAVLAISFAAPDPSPASPTLVPADTPPAGSRSGGFSLGPGDLASLAWRLALVVIVIAGSIIGLRWWARRMAAPRSTTGFLRVVDTLPIANGRTIHLLALGDRVIAIGATAQQITMLNELTPEEAATVLAEADRAAPAPLGDFAAQLLESLRRHQPASPPPAPADPIIGAEPRR